MNLSSELPKFAFSRPAPEQRRMDDRTLWYDVIKMIEHFSARRLSLHGAPILWTLEKNDAEQDGYPCRSPVTFCPNLTFPFGSPPKYIL